MSELNDMTCGELADVAAELALGVLTGRERAMAVAHLDNCDECREHVRQLMATGEQLLQLLPSAEPPAGFETRVLERLGLPAPAQDEARDEASYPRLISPHGSNPGRSGPARGGTRPHGDEPRGDRPRGDRPGADQPSAPPTGPGTRTRRPGRMRRLLAATAVGLAIVVAGLGGWRIGAGSAPAASSAAGPLKSASLLTATHQEVGEIFAYSGESRWLYMSVDMGSGNEAVTCEVVGQNGQVSKVGTFRLADGYGSWGSPNPGNFGTLSGARLVSTDGTVLATASFSTQ
ncbi:MAG: hypothetical protein ACRDNO_24520 [Trebonia sp.]